MSNYVRSAAYAASQALAAQGLAVKRSHLSEVIAALLGYRTFAALTVDEANSTLLYHLEDAEIIVLNLPMGEARSVELGSSATGGSPSVAVKACVEALKACANSANVYVGVAEFYDSHARQALAEAIADDDGVSGTMAESNAVYPDDPEMDEACPTTADLWAATDEWKIEAEGVLLGEYDPEGDRMFNGDTLNCAGWLTYSKAGRAGLVLLDKGGVAGADDDWRDPDYGDQ